ncbi:MAG: elongation factor G [Bacillota bacterium]|nr:elongation factor G [Bacillota bacterium]MDI9414648.1 elongation factor G [Bacillota bacterium]NLD12250.1 elongation factor G [Bacillota bacterium]HOB88007.1 elongation factor G [Bacillota bacterium]HOJ57018.1 elongation factor G [Bacillota bacterium]
MKRYRTEDIRNVALVAHSGAGKTSLGDAVLFNAKAIDRMGRVDEGTSTLDYEPDEIKRKITISTTVAHCEWQNTKINLVDTPGYADFIGDVKSGLRVVESAIVAVCATAGVEVGTENVWQFADERALPRMVVITKLDRENADFYKTIDAVRNTFGTKCAVIQLPIGSQDSFRGVVDLISMKAYVYDGSSSGKFQEQDIPDDLKETAENYRSELIEAAVESDDELIEKYLEGEELSEEEIRKGLRQGVAEGSVYPIICVSALKNVGIKQMLDTIVAYLPSPADIDRIEGKAPGSDETKELAPKDDAPLSALVFKTTADPFVGKISLFRVYSGTMRSDGQVYNSNEDTTERVGQLFFMKGKQQEPVDQVSAGDIGAVAKLGVTGTGDTLCDKSNPVVLPGINFPKPTLAMAMKPKAKGDEDKIGSGLARLTEEDPTIVVHRDAETAETIVEGLGEVHLEVTAERLKRKFGAEVVLDTPRIPYRETIRGTAKAEGKHKKQTGGRGQYGHVFLEISPLPPGGDFEFEDKIFGGAVPKQYIPAVEKGVRETLVEGVLAGYPLVDLKVTLYDGSYHPVDSSEMAFKIASSMALKKGVMDASPVLLEPIMDVEVTVPEYQMGDVMGDLNKRRGRILGMEPQGNKQVIKAQVPMAEMFKYAIDLRSITAGRGSFTMEFSHYEEVPAAISQQVIEKAKQEREQQ